MSLILGPGIQDSAQPWALGSIASLNLLLKLDLGWQLFCCHMVRAIYYLLLSLLPGLAPLFP